MNTSTVLFKRKLTIFYVTPILFEFSIHILRISVLFFCSCSIFNHLSFKKCYLIFIKLEKGTQEEHFVPVREVAAQDLKVKLTNNLKKPFYLEVK